MAPMGVVLLGVLLAMHKLPSINALQRWQLTWVLARVQGCGLASVLLDGGRHCQCAGRLRPRVPGWWVSPDPVFKLVDKCLNNPRKAHADWLGGPCLKNKQRHAGRAVTGLGPEGTDLRLFLPFGVEHKSLTWPTRMMHLSIPPMTA